VTQRSADRHGAQHTVTGWVGVTAPDASPPLGVQPPSALDGTASDAERLVVQPAPAASRMATGLAQPGSENTETAPPVHTTSVAGVHPHGVQLR
jgi:hypothetical protein